MDFGQSIRTCLSKYATFAGRAMRSEYWWFVLFGVLASAAAGIVDATIFGYGPDELMPFSWLLSLALLLPSLAVGARRLHDTDRSGWWLLIGLIPVIGIIVLIVWFAQKGTPGSNRFGPAPGAGEFAHAEP